ncbi:hypothetical protein [Aeromonas hydrophila]|uniref:hypothetical protein n=1 Tax=Aeromonas hydrophila TaxID=644 RepID=UPI000574D5D0|nr:hypothetical protein [Aeromonas hydrophila]KHN59945.1 hypothetical protein OI72_05400 [Aeromonas hydrophila]OFC42764.1 hypothetical protein BA189_04430 [Aeromonas hydrophila]OFC52660.1 hypothetical protein BA188_11740 [Aeromonas hydrophila]
MPDWILLKFGTYPPENIGVLVCDEVGERFIGNHRGGDWSPRYLVRREAPEVMHWMPLPSLQSIDWRPLEAVGFPSDRVPVLVRDDKGAIFILSHHHGYWRGTLSGKPLKLTHWMPLPKAPSRAKFKAIQEQHWKLIFDLKMLVLFIVLAISIFA